ncbi:activator of 90 kDa heat shock protein ATPase homolog 1 isoform X2 [Panulirus ornatus]|uniref:activator of 90 kDa heat shock protein ATPase homolog 1 isoform X2 n=1 Tax=Panulirus ornatus TaxID=150431 RepID=UPI003A889517
MAKWGEGDPRWIVEERPDATNVNNWHWSEKNASGWSKEKLKSLFEDMTLEEPGLATVTIKEISKCEGEATASNRKGKLIFFYEWVLKMDWIAILHEDPQKDVKGSIEIPNLSEENDPEEIEVSVLVSSGGSAGDKVKEFLRKKGILDIQGKIREYIDTLKKEYALDLIKPTKGQAVTKQSKTHITTVQTDNSFNANVINTTNNIEKMELGCRIHTCKINLNQTFKCTADELYRALTQREVPNKQIVQKWRFKSWPKGHFSTVTIEIEQKEDCTELRLSQSGVPSNEVDRTKEGWQNYYWESIKRTFGFGATLM